MQKVLNLHALLKERYDYKIFYSKAVNKKILSFPQSARPFDKFFVCMRVNVKKNSSLKPQGSRISELLKVLFGWDFYLGRISIAIYLLVLIVYCF